MASEPEKQAPVPREVVLDVPTPATRSQRDGFDIVQNVVSVTEIDALAGRLAASSFARSRAGARHLMGHHAVAEIASDQRLLQIARQFVGDSAVPYRATLFDKSSVQNWLVPWHQDTALPIRERREVHGWGPWSTKAGITYAHAPAAALSRAVALRLHLDDSRADNGPLRVLPGTHGLGVLTDQDIARLAAEVSAVDCVVPAGGVVAMCPLVVHASSKADSDLPRRVLHIEYAQCVDLGDGLQLAIA